MIENSTKHNFQLTYTDLSYLKQCTNSNPLLMKEMISLYLAQTPLLVAEMSRSADDKDWTSLYSAIHKLIPSFAIMGFNAEIQNVANEIQELAVARPPSQTITALIIQLAKACTQSCIELNDEYNRIKI